MNNSRKSYDLADGMSRYTSLQDAPKGKAQQDGSMLDKITEEGGMPNTARTKATTLENSDDEKTTIMRHSPNLNNMSAY